MKALSIAGALAIALTFGTGMALAQSTPRVGDGQHAVAPPNTYGIGAGAAKVGDGSNTTPVPYSYNVGAGAAHVSDGSEPGFQKQQDQLQRSPGYSVGGSTAKTDSRQ